MDLNFTVTNQFLKRTDTNVPASDASDYLRFVFDFTTDDWTGLDKFVFFRVKGLNYNYPVTDDALTVPAIFVSGESVVFGVYGKNDDGLRITTNAVKLYLENSFYDCEPVDVRNFVEKIVDELNAEIDGKVDKVDGKALSSNDFNNGYKAQLDNLDTVLSGKSDVGHNHDDRYYTETETDELLDFKVDKIDGKGLSTHDFTDHYKRFLDGFDGDIEAFLLEHKAEIEALITEEVLATKSDVGHTHDDRYYTESESDELLDLKSDVGHGHDDRYYTESETDALLDTKVDKEEGMELSSNDFSDLYKEILDTMEDNYFKKSELKTETGKLTRLNGETVYGEFLLVKPPQYGMIISFTGEVFESPLYNYNSKFQGGAIIDWGDGTTTTYQYNTALYHQYSEYGQYTIKISQVIYSASYVAFNGMTNPNSKVGVKLPSHFTSVPNYYFYNSPSVVNVIIPQSVTSIGEQAFRASGLTSIELPSSLTSIGGNAFQNCQGLTSIELPSSLTSIGGLAFYECNALKKYILNWASSETILRYTHLINWSPAPTDITFSIPAGTTDLYTAKGYPSDKLIERSS